MARKKAAIKTATERGYETIGFRLSKGEKAKILKQAKRHGYRGMSEWLRQAGQRYSP